MLKIRAFIFDNDIEKIIPLDYYIMGKRPIEAIRESYKNYNGEIFIAEDNDEIVGYVSLSFPHWDKVAYIDYLAVVESRRNQGIGHKLVQKVKILAREKSARIIAVPTALWNIRGIGFYKREGFQLRAVLSNWIGDGNDLLWLDETL
ncbi:MAG: GNAT family N-acetyltransferase [Candidatus Stahlbacteria bacterium]|nr:GNAT family N-acetyltransferase [Candidatus Stahlbacteria bacterium]